MAIFEITQQAIEPLAQVLAEEYGAWEDARRSIDLLCLDKSANLVVIELTRTDDGGHMELQALRYAAMVSKMTFEHAVEAHARYLSRIDDTKDASEAILSFLDWDEPQLQEFAQAVRIILVSADFSKEITSTVMWLTTDYDLDISCIRLQPYQLDGRVLVDIQQILPLPEVSAYQVQFKRKAAEERQGQARSMADWSRYDLHVGDRMIPNLTKRALFLSAVRALVAAGMSISKISEHLPSRKFIRIPGNLSGDQFRERMTQIQRPNGGSYDPRRWYLDDEELMHSNGETVALSNQWGIGNLPALDKLLGAYSEQRIEYVKRDDVAGEES